MIREVIEELNERRIKWEDIEDADAFAFYFEDGLELTFKNKNGKWVEDDIDGGDLDNWGGKTYQSYLSAQDIYTWLQQDYNDLPKISGMEIL